MKRLALSALLFFCALLTAQPAFAQPTNDPEKLFAEGSALMEQGKYAEALPKLERAQQADPGIGTMFNIAVCHQKLGRLGTAYRMFREVTALARASGKKAREEAAHAKVDELKPQAPAFVVRTVDPGDVTLRIDGETLKKEDWTFYPVDPGEHTIEAFAPAKKTWSEKRPTPPAGKVEEIAVPALETAASTKIVTVTTTDNRRTLGFVVGGVGVAGVITAGITGVMLLHAHGTANDDCPKKICRNPDGTQNKEGADAVSLGKTLLPINAIGWGVAAVGLGVGTYLVLTSGKPREASKVALAPVIDLTGRGMNGASLAGSF